MGGKTNVKTWQVILLFLLVVAVCTSSVFATGTYDGGDGSEGSPFQINTAAQMDEIGQHPEDWDKCFILTADINLSGYTGTEFNIIGNSTTQFTGSFDGNGHTISNFTYTTTGTDRIGLFGCVGTAGGEIKNLGMEDVNVDAGTGWYVGGLVGKSNGPISDCYATGEITGVLDVGGLVGWNVYDVIYGIGNITNCYSVGGVSGTLYVGGLVGINDAEISTSLWDTQTSGGSNMCGRQGGSGTGCDDGNGKTTVEMQMASTFISASWDFVAVWDICEGTSYPRLVWQIPVGDMVCPYGVEMRDFSVLGLAWLSSSGQPNWNPVCDISDPNDNFIDELDLGVFCDNWLFGK